MAAATLVTFALSMTASALMAFAVTMAASALAMVTLAVSTAVASAFLWKVLTVETLCELLLGSLAYRDDLSCEVHGLACHRWVEVHGHLLFLDLHDHTVADFTTLVEHRDILTHLEEILAEFAVHHE